MDLSGGYNMAGMKFDLGSIVKNVKNAIDPEASVPIDSEANPLAYRVFRLNQLVKEVKAEQEAIAEKFANIETNLTEVVAELKIVADAKEAEIANEKSKQDEGQSDSAAKAEEHIAESKEAVKEEVNEDKGKEEDKK